LLPSTATYTHTTSFIPTVALLHTLALTLPHRYARAGLSQANVDLFEINEAFAAGRLVYVLPL
jgi:hypothetical protein